MDVTVHLALATAAFLATHFLPSTPARAWLVARFGERAYLGLYSLLAAAMLSWMIWAYNRAPIEPLWDGWRYLPLVVMPFAMILLVSGYFSRNPSMVMQQGALKSTEPARGMLRITRHPLMWAIALWSASHVFARGDLRSLIFFGGFLLLALLGTVSIDRRKAATLGEDWRRYAALTSNLPFLAIAQGRNSFSVGEIGWRKPLIGLALFVVFFFSHAAIFGLRPY